MRLDNSLPECGEGCQLLTSEGVDLVAKHHIKWYDDETSEVCFYLTDGKRAEKKTGWLHLDNEPKTGQAATQVEVIEGLRFIPAQT